MTYLRYCVKMMMDTSQHYVVAYERDYLDIYTEPTQCYMDIEGSLWRWEYEPQFYHCPSRDPPLWHNSTVTQAVTRGVRASSCIRVNEPCVWRDPSLYVEEICPPEVCFVVRWHLKEPAASLKELRRWSEHIGKDVMTPHSEEVLHAVLRLHIRYPRKRKQRHWSLRAMNPASNSIVEHGIRTSLLTTMMPTAHSFNSAEMHDILTS